MLDRSSEEADLSVLNNKSKELEMSVLDHSFPGQRVTVLNSLTASGIEASVLNGPGPGSPMLDNSSPGPDQSSQDHSCPTTGMSVLDSTERTSPVLYHSSPMVPVLNPSLPSPELPALNQKFPEPVGLLPDHRTECPGEPIHIVSATDDHTFQMDHEALARILLRPDVEDNVVSVSSLAGMFRKGKSFRFNFLLRYLKAGNWHPSVNQVNSAEDRNQSKLNPARSPLLLAGLLICFLSLLFLLLFGLCSRTTLVAAADLLLLAINQLADLLLEQIRSGLDGPESVKHVEPKPHKHVPRQLHAPAQTPPMKALLPQIALAVGATGPAQSEMFPICAVAVGMGLALLLLYYGAQLFEWVSHEIQASRNQRWRFERSWNAFNRLTDLRNNLQGYGHRPSDLESFLNAITHAVFVPTCTVGTVMLFKSASSNEERIVAVVYGGPMVGMFVISTLYHTVCYYRIYSFPRKLLHKMDKSAAFVSIAATYTPWLCLRSYKALSTEILILTWLLSVCGVLHVFFKYQRFKHLDYFMYLFIVLLPAFELLTLMEEREGLLELIGTSIFYLCGLAYFKSDGRILFAHAIWHVFAGIGVVCQMLCVYVFLFLA